MFVIKLFPQQKDIKKDVDLVLSFYEVPQLPLYQIRKAHDIHVGFSTYLIGTLLKFCGFHKTKNKQKRFFKSLNFQSANV